MENKPTCSSGRYSGKYLVALVLIIWGVLMFVRNIGWINWTLYHTLVSWPMLLIVIGLYLFSRKNAGQGLILLIIGGCFLLPRLSLPWFPINISNVLTWPLVLIVVGVVFIIRARRPKQFRQRFSGRGRMGSPHDFDVRSDSTDGFVFSDNMFGGVRQVVLDEVFKGAAIRNNFGGTVLDLRRTSLAPGETYIDLDCSFGGVEIYVPANWKVNLQANALLGGCEDKRMSAVNVDQTRILVIRGNVTFGGVEIKD